MAAMPWQTKAVKDHCPPLDHPERPPYTTGMDGMWIITFFPWRYIYEAQINSNKACAAKVWCYNWSLLIQLTHYWITVICAWIMQYELHWLMHGYILYNWAIDPVEFCVWNFKSVKNCAFILLRQLYSLTFSACYSLYTCYKIFSLVHVHVSLLQ